MTTTTNRREPFFRRLTGGFRRLDTITKIVLIGFVAAGLITAVLAFGYVNRLVGCSPTGVFAGSHLASCGGPVEDPTGPEFGGDPEQTTSEQPVVAPSGDETFHYVAPTRWDGSSRVNILIMGLDARDWEVAQGAPRTDTMMVLTYDPVTKTAGMLSIPRDIWVEIPGGYGHDKINNAYAIGEGNRLPGGGAGLAVQTVEQFLGITINFYAQIDFKAFEQFIDIIGGVKLHIQSDIRVQLIGETETRLIRGSQGSDGRQVLNGAYALAYARARKEGDGDFDRARRQQEVILAIRQQLARNDVRALVLNNTLQIYEALASGINTNMTLADALSLGWAVKDIDLANIEKAVIAPNACDMPQCLGKDFVTIDRSPDGLSILKPITENIRILRDQVFASGTIASNVSLTSQAVDLMRMEASNVSVLNGSGFSGMAESTAAYLQGQGMVVASTGNADPVGVTTIYDYTGNPYTIRYLMELMNIPASRIFSRYDPNSAIDLEVVVGPEWVVP
jgi:LCP family protein required for cell wall assembly